MPEPVVHTDSLAAAPHREAPRKAQTVPAKEVTAPKERVSSSTQAQGAISPKELTAFHRADTTAFAQVQPTDSLAAQEAVDWSTALPYTVYGTAESLETDPASGPAVYRDARPEEIFGVLSTTIPASTHPQLSAPSLTANTAFQGFVLLLAATFAILLTHNLADVRQLLTRITHNASVGQHISESPGSSGFARFLNTTTAIGLLFVGVISVRYIDPLFSFGQFNQLPHIAALGFCLLVALGCAAIIFYQWFVLKLIGTITRSQAMISQLFFLKRTFFSLAVIISAPILLLYALCPRGTGEGWFVVVLIELAITVLLYFWESLNLFISKKISILHWFLYLCAVEIFPLSLLWLLAVR